MAQIPPLQRITTDQIPDAPTWLGGLLTPLNRYFQAVYSALNGGLTVGQNVRGVVTTLTFTATSAYIPQTFAWNLLGAPPQLVVLAQVRAAAPVTATDAPITLNQWTYQNGAVSLDSIVGLKTGVRYTITLLAV